MPEVIVDKEKLAYGLERGIEHTDTIFVEIPRKYILRGTPCGLVTSGIHEYTEAVGIPSKRVISTPDWSFDPELQHTFPLIGGDTENAVVVDASYSQFFTYIGLPWGYELATGTKEFPDDKILTFRLSERDVIAGWMSKVAVEFQGRNVHPEGVFSEDLGVGPLAEASHEEINAVYSRIWEPALSEPWLPPERVVKHGTVVANYIPKDAITIS
ncbi:hypothetical protein HY379_00550 [Candidatus Saccharibacteria bacterium]|nr:hypothetical protein [Candidatus Saccharibacteria bacterium]